MLRWVYYTVKKVNCIYRITFEGSAKMYIGSTVHFDRRKRQHESALRRGIHHSMALQRAYRKYTDMQFEVIEVVENVDMLWQVEQMWIDTLGMSNLYNCSPVVGASCARATPAQIKATRKAIDKRYHAKNPHKRKELRDNWYARNKDLISVKNKSERHDRRAEHKARWDKYVASLTPERMIAFRLSRKKTVERAKARDLELNGPKPPRDKSQRYHNNKANMTTEELAEFMERKREYTRQWRAKQRNEA